MASSAQAATTTTTASTSEVQEAAFELSALLMGVGALLQPQPAHICATIEAATQPLLAKLPDTPLPPALLTNALLLFLSSSHTPSSDWVATAGKAMQAQLEKAGSQDLCAYMKALGSQGLGAGLRAQVPANFPARILEAGAKEALGNRMEAMQVRTACMRM